MIKNIFCEIKKIRFFKKDKSLPSVLYVRFHKLSAFSAAGALCALMVLLAGLNIIIFAAIFALSAALFLMAAAYKYSLEQRGFKAVEGEITFSKEGPLSSFKMLRKAPFSGIIYYHLKDDYGGIYRFDADKSGEEIPQNSRVVVYLPLDEQCYERSGVTVLPRILGYEVLS